MMSEIQAQSVQKLTLSVVSSRELQQQELSPLIFIVEGILPQGLAVMAAPSKYGKSWMALDLCLSVALGHSFMGRNTQAGDSLYLALEDGLRRLKHRQELLLQGETAPDNLHLATVAKTIDTGLLQQLSEHINDHPSIRLIVVDVLARVRSSSSRRTDAYRLDYDDIAALKQLADNRNICILVIHHTRKMRDDTDIYNAISGTTGLMGAADTLWVLSRKNREDERTALHVIGRDVEQQSIVISLDKVQHRWRAIGTVQEEDAQLEQERYEADPAIKTVKALLRKNPYGFTMSASEFMEAMAQNAGEYGTHAGPSELGRFFPKVSEKLLQYNGIIYSGGRSMNGRFHTFKPKGTDLILISDAEGESKA
jgi:RecA-family ATPase